MSDSPSRAPHLDPHEVCCAADSVMVDYFAA
jgi:hypothetical protein